MKYSKEELLLHYSCGTLKNINLCLIGLNIRADGILKDRYDNVLNKEQFEFWLDKYNDFLDFQLNEDIFTARPFVNEVYDNKIEVLPRYNIVESLLGNVQSTS